MIIESFHRSRSVIAFVALIGASLSACDREVMLDEQGGAGGDGNAGGTGGLPDAVSDGSGLGGAGGAPAATPGCEAYCAAAVVAGCDSGEEHCLTICPLEALAGKCAPLVDAGYACEAQVPISDFVCYGNPPACDEQLQAFEACARPPGHCDPEACDFSQLDGIECSQTCGDTLYEGQCVSDGTTNTCDCRVDGVSVGSCTGPHIARPDECCNALFAETG